MRLTWHPGLGGLETGVYRRVKKIIYIHVYMHPHLRLSFERIAVNVGSVIPKRPVASHYPTHTKIYFCTPTPVFLLLSSSSSTTDLSIF